MLKYHRNKISVTSSSALLFVIKLVHIQPI